jgi:GTP-binding protein
MPFTVVLVGRPNVGKSTLFNRLVGARRALVDNQPAVTRDRREGKAHLGDLSFTVIDTAGLEKAIKDGLPGRMRAQTVAAMTHADAVFFLVDARAGVTGADRDLADLARKSGKPIILVANKSEGRAGEAIALDAYALGFGDPVVMSAEHGEGLSGLYDALRSALPEATAESEPAEIVAGEKPIRIAVVGRPNTGKSTLINRLLGQERLVTGPESGTTRDAIAVDFEWRGRRLRIYDTAGLRRRSRIVDKIEKLAAADARDAVRFAEVVVVLMDAQAPFEEQDIRIVDLVEQEGRAIVIAINKVDLMPRQANVRARLRQDADRLLAQIKGVPLVLVSASTGEGLDELMAAAMESQAVWNRRVPTAALNRFLGEAVGSHSPPAVKGRPVRLDYMTQPKSRPPTFVLFAARAAALPETYRRYLINGLRETFDLPGTPIRLNVRAKANPFAKRKRR